MKCKKCNQENKENAIFCENCGNAFDIDTMTSSHRINNTEDKIKTGEFCFSCGHKLENDTIFCVECGTQQEIICPKCETSNSSDAMYCSNCATGFPIICLSCSTENSADSEFCENCGSKLAQRSGKTKKLIKHPVFITATSIILLLVIISGYTLNRFNHYMEIAQKAYSGNDMQSVTSNLKDAETYAFLSTQKEEIKKKHFSFINLQTDKAISQTKKEEYDKAIKTLKKANQLCINPQFSDYLNNAYKKCLEFVIEKGNNFTAENKFKKAKVFYDQAEDFTKTSSQKELLADNVSTYKSKKVKYDEKQERLRRQREQQRRNSYNGGGSSGSSTYASVFFHWGKHNHCFIRKSKVSVTGNDYYKYTGTDNVTLSNSSGIAGYYNFTYSKKCDGWHTISGRFYIDGSKSSYYTVTIDSNGYQTIR